MSLAILLYLSMSSDLLSYFHNPFESSLLFIFIMPEQSAKGPAWRRSVWGKRHPGNLRRIRVQC